jgi:di/tricarboxylate transporter
MVVSNVGATVIMVPMAISIALAAGGNPTAFALIVALSASNNLISVSNPVLSMVAGPAGYRGIDLLKVGAPLAAMYILIVLVGVNLIL